MRSWEVPRCHPRGPAILPPGAARTVEINSDRDPPGAGRAAAGAGSDPTAPPARAPEDPAWLVTERCPESAAKAGRGPVSARGGRFPRPGEKMRRR